MKKGISIFLVLLLAGLMTSCCPCMKPGDKDAGEQPAEQPAE